MTTILAIVAGCLVWFLVGLGVGLAIGKIADQDPPTFRNAVESDDQLVRVLKDLDYLHPSRAITTRETSNERTTR